MIDVFEGVISLCCGWLFASAILDSFDKKDRIVCILLSVLWLIYAFVK